MARFYTSASNSRGNTTTAQGRDSGQDVHIRGWDRGVEVRAHKDESGVDVFDLYMTGGSNGSRVRRYMGTVRDDDTEWVLVNVATLLDNAKRLGETS